MRYLLTTVLLELVSLAAPAQCPGGVCPAQRAVAVTRHVLAAPLQFVRPVPIVGVPMPMPAVQTKTITKTKTSVSVRHRPRLVGRFGFFI
jgi:hypothetical protein